MNAREERLWWVLRLTFGLVPIVAGLDKFTNILTDWQQYLSPWVSAVVPAALFMHVVGAIEIVAGALVFTRFTRWAALLVSVWLVWIAINLLTTGRYFDVAVRDVVMAIGAFALSELSAVREASEVPARLPGPMPDYSTRV